MKAAGLIKLEGFSGSLPKPLHTFLISGAHYNTNGLEPALSSKFLGRVERGMLRPGTTNLTRIKLEQTTSAAAWKAYNQAAKDICTVLRERYNLPMDEGHVYTPDLTSK